MAGSFQLEKDLWDALCYLRKRGGRYRYWIDAICINQVDIPERNRQLRIMPHIYARAQEVLVLGGQSYAVHDANYLASWNMDILDHNLSSLHEDDLHRKRLWMQYYMIQALCSDGYWDRLWIIQEIGKARKLQLAFGEYTSMEITWEAFIERIKALSRNRLHCVGANRPLQLAKQREEKIDRGYNLRKLLDSHQNAICKDPRDKIYGLVGLADDTRHFPMDYEKSLVEIWKDTMLFLYRQRKLSDDEIIPFERRLKQTLGEAIESAHQIEQKYASHKPFGIHDSPHRSHTIIFDLPMFVAGIIMSTGPSPEELISVLDVEADWKDSIRQNFYGGQEFKAFHDHELLMEELLNENLGTSQVVYHSEIPFRWRGDTSLDRAISKFIKGKERYESKFYWRQSTSFDTKVHSKDNTASASSRFQTCMYQLERISGTQTPWKLGIATSDAQAGDFICWLAQLQKALILRLEDGWLRIIGATAAPTGLMTIGPRYFFPKSHDTSYHTSYEVDDKWLEERFKLRIDAETLYILLG